MATRVPWHVYRQAVKGTLETGCLIWGLPSILSSPLNVFHPSEGQLIFSVLQVSGKSRSDVFELIKPVSKAMYSLGPQFQGRRYRIDIAWIKIPPFI